MATFSLQDKTSQIDKVRIRLLKFSVVGASGILVNMGLLFFFTDVIGVPYFVSSPFAIEGSIVSNFFMNMSWTWKGRGTRGTLWQRMLRYHLAVGLSALFGNYLVLLGLTEVFGLHYTLSNLIGICAGAAGNYLLNDAWTFKSLSP